MCSFERLRGHDGLGVDNKFAAATLDQAADIFGGKEATCHVL